MCRMRLNNRGISLIELTVILVVIGILTAVAMKSMTGSIQNIKRANTEREMESLAKAIVGDPAMTTDGERSDFGYFGDVGAFPPDLGALYSNPGSYTTWRGPYIDTKLAQDSVSFRMDEWGKAYTYTSGVSISSSGSGSAIVKKLADSPNDYLRNKWAGTIHDKNDSLPGSIKKDSLDIYVTYPNGSGGNSTKLYHPDASGQFQFDSIPAGRQALKIIYLPTNDTLLRYATVLPRQKINNPKLYKLASSFSGGSGSSSTYLTKVAGSDSVYSSGCANVCFWIANTTGSSKTISSIKLSWPSPTAYYATVYWGNTIVFDKDGSPRGVSGTTYSFSASQTIADGQQVRIRIADFATHNSNGGGGNENMTNANLSVLFSDGSSITVYSGTCY